MDKYLQDLNFNLKFILVSTNSVEVSSSGSRGSRGLILYNWYERRVNMKIKIFNPFSLIKS